VSPAPCANATGALNISAAIATEYFNIFVSYADTHSPAAVTIEREIRSIVPSIAFVRLRSRPRIEEQNL
jgi:hypothetical protein